MVSISVDLVYSQRVHYALQQNSVPVVREVRVVNESEEELADVAIRVRIGPEISEIWEVRLASLGAGRAHRFEPTDLALRGETLARLDERCAAALHVEVLVGDVVETHVTRAVDVLAYNEWPGTAVLPEILAAFVLPNHPANAVLLQRTADRLAATRDGDRALDGYQGGDPGRVLEQVQALHEALRELSWTYVSPPASFEADGQKIRTPDQVVGDRLATCLDLAVLQAACLEQMGLRPFLVLVEGHAFAGCWLRPDACPEPVTTDPLWLRKRVELGEIAVFESTAVCDPGTDFDKARADARRRLYQGEQFHLAVDVFAARRAGIRPLPARTGGAPVEAPSVRPGALVDAERFAAGPGGGDEGEPLPAVAPPAVEPERDLGDTGDRVQRWKRRLLDLTLRNRLLNYVDTKKTLPLLVPEAAELEDALAAGSWFRLRSMGEARAEDLRVEQDEEARVEYLRAELGSRRLRTSLSESELERRLIEVHRAARLSVEEGGANTLYLGVGFLRWFEAPSSNQERRAPLLLLPLQLERLSVAEGFRFRLADEEPKVNTTLLQKLQAEFDLDVRTCEPLPEDDSGLDVAAILTNFRRLVRDVDRWEVVEEACIGFFSFTKYLMWLDLHERADQLRENPFLGHLIDTPHVPFDQAEAFQEPESLDRELDPVATFCPKDADSSQLCAVVAAARGQSYVLEGPPGTGKSQTITNLIAQCLGEGRQVLFVAEKRAALDVVRRRLDEVGLGPFCLEVHSNKGSKREVLAQLGRPLDLARAREPEAWERHATELQEARNELNGYVERVHRHRRCGLSVFDALGQLIGLRDVSRLEVAFPEGTADEFRAQKDCVGAAAAASAAAGDLKSHPWRDVAFSDWQPAAMPAIERAIKAFVAGLSDHEGAVSELAAECGVDVPADRDGLAALATLRDLLRSTPRVAPALLDGSFRESLDRVRRWCELGRARDVLAADLRGRWEAGLTGLLLDDLDRRFQRWGTAWAPFRWFFLRGARAELSRVAIQGRLPDVAVILEDLPRARELRDRDSQLRGFGADARALLGTRLWNEGDADWDAVEDALGWVEELRRVAVALFAGDTTAAVAATQRWAEAAADPDLHLSEATPLGAALVRSARAERAFDEARGEVVRLLIVDETAVFAPEGDWFAAVRGRADGWATNLDGLRDWSAWRRSRGAAADVGLEPVLEAMESGAVRSGEAPGVFERSYIEGQVDRWFADEPELRQFRGLEHEARIERFRDLDRRSIELASQVVRARLLARVPSSAGAVAASELGILLRELKKQRRHLPVRQLFARIPNLLPRLSPCLLMSPLSVAQFLATTHERFDIVVFDEASQIPVWDAVGAIGRGRQVVVVGDSKQLPPTNFFETADDEDAAVDDDFEELESILDECVAAGLDRLGLRWHYRSQHESLIAFSNHHYYENRLHTFPAPEAGDLGVEWVPVPDGVYDRASARHNRREAEVLVAELLRRLRDPELSELSHGIVTFSVAQQILIEDLLDAARRKHPEIERFFGDGENLDHGEPVFVKNLENVQGDERDVMLFSVCYGPDLAGKVYMNFGPLNRDGGERRLNVAVTRARRRLLVFSTLRPEQIDLTRTRARGAEHLRAFLDYAQRGMTALAESVAVDPVAEFDSPFERDVARALEDRGHVVHRQIGCSGYRIDLAIVDPERAGRYLIGVECDGRTYHSAATARDRDRTRQSVLEHLGWTLARVWSTDWWIDPRGEIDRIEARLAEARLEWERRDADRAAREARAAALRVEVESVESPDAEPAAPEAEEAPSPDGEVEDEEPTAVPADPSMPTYPKATAVRGGDAQGLYESKSAKRLAGHIETVVEAEGPVHEDVLVRRIADGWGISRATAKVRERVAEIARGAGYGADADGVHWPTGLDLTGWRAFRATDERSADRDADELPPVEVANAAEHVLRACVAVPVEDLLRETARLFGITRLGRAVRESMRRGLDRLVARGGAVLEGDSVRLPEDG